MKWSKKALLLKIEDPYGTDATPAGETDDVLIIGSDVTLQPVAGSYVEREVVRTAGEYGSFTQFLTGKHVILEFSVEMAGGGDADTPPHYGPALRACGLAEAITAETDVEYAPVSEDYESVTGYINIDGMLYKLLGARGEAGWTLDTLGRPMIRFRLMALFSAVTDVAFPTMDYSGAVKPLIVSDANTPTFTLHGETVKVAACSLNLGNVVEYRELVNDTEIVITDRRSVGSITFEHVTVATKDWYGAVTGETLGALQIVHGSVAGNICQIDAPKVQLTNPRPSGSQDRKMLTCDMALTPDAGDDEFVFTTK